MSSVLPLFDEIVARGSDPVTLAEPLTIEQLPTPALVLDHERFAANLVRMQMHAVEAGKGLRPHAKTHKCPQVAKAQLASGALGVCVAKLGEAAAMLSAGVSPVLVTSPIVTAVKAAVIPRLAAMGQLCMVVDSDLGLDVLISALEEDNTSDAAVTVFVDLDLEMGRTGVREDNVMLRLVERIHNGGERLRFGGVQYYAGHLMHITGFGERRSRSLAGWEKIAQRVQYLAERGFVCAAVTGCGTGTWDIDVDAPVVTDMQVGSYAFMDAEYCAIENAQGSPFDGFAVSLTCATTVISSPAAGAATVDAGFKALASDTIAPECLDEGVRKFRFGGDEHGILILKDGANSPQRGDVVSLVTPHCDPTVNLHRWFWVRDADGMVRNAWPITASGAVW